MSNSNQHKSPKVFDRSVCFTFFNDYHKTAASIEEGFGPIDALNYYKAVANYALLDMEPELEGPLALVWPTTKASIDASINRHRSGFGEEDTEMTEKVKEYSAEHSDATQREIADAVGCSLGKLNKSLNEDKDTSSSADSGAGSATDVGTGTYSPFSTSGERERSLSSEGEKTGGINTENWGRRSLSDLSSEELDDALAMYRRREDWQGIRDKYGLPMLDVDGEYVINKYFEDSVREAKKVALEREHALIGETALKDAEAKPELSEHLASRLGITIDEFLSIVPTLGQPFDIIQWLIEDVCSDSAQLSHAFWEENLTGFHSTYQKYFAAYFTDDYYMRRYYSMRDEQYA